MPYITSIERMAREKGLAETLAEREQLRAELRTLRAETQRFRAETQRFRAETQRFREETQQFREAAQQFHAESRRFLIENLTNLLVYRFGQLGDEDPARLQRADNQTLRDGSGQTLAVANPSALYKTS